LLNAVIKTKSLLTSNAVVRPSGGGDRHAPLTFGRFWV
jgi:hypothetical protein